MVLNGNRMLNSCFFFFKKNKKTKAMNYKTMVKFIYKKTAQKEDGCQKENCCRRSAQLSLI